MVAPPSEGGAVVEVVVDVEGAVSLFRGAVVTVTPGTPSNGRASDSGMLDEEVVDDAGVDVLVEDPGVVGAWEGEPVSPALANESSSAAGAATAAGRGSGLRTSLTV
jgi:hypothetical protein